MTLPVELTDARLDSLRQKESSIRERFENVDFDTAITEPIFDSVAEGFEKLEKQRQNFESAHRQAAGTMVAEDLYRKYLHSLDKQARRLEVLEEESVYLDLHEQQQSDARRESLKRTKVVCRELRSAFDISRTILPVINDGYATTPLGGTLEATGDRDDSEVYILSLPRESTPERYEPLLMHEIGHMLLDDHPILRGDARSLARGREDQMRGIDDLVATWESWFRELFCDVCGILGYGPAYVCALLRRLTMSTPFYFESGENAEHPPDSLRFDVVHKLAEREFPDLLTVIHSDVTGFERHLNAYDDDQSEEYDVYDDDELFEFVLDRVPDAVGGDLDGLLEDVRKGVDPSDSSERQYRLEANQRLLPSYPPQNGG